MAVPQDALPWRRKLGRKGKTVRIRRKDMDNIGLYCGTVITVPYIAGKHSNSRSRCAPVQRPSRYAARW